MKRLPPAPPPRPPLDAEAVTSAGLTLLDEVGLDEFSMRRLAQALGVQNPALYWHVRDKQELLDRMAQRLLTDGFAQVEAGRAPRSWDQALERLARGMRAAMLARRDGARLVASADLARGTELVVRMDRLVAALVAAGFPGPTALAGVLTAIHYTMGATFEQQADPRAGSPGLPAGLHLPALAAAGALMVKLRGGVERPAEDTRFDLGLRLIVDGLRQQRPERAAGGAARRPTKS